jgi:hypothetical protein
MEELQEDAGEQDVVRLAETMARLLDIAPAKLRLECHFGSAAKLRRVDVHIGPLTPDELRALVARGPA